MRQSEMQILLDLMQREEREVRAAGQKEYAHDDADALANFRRTGEAVTCKCEHCGKQTRIGPIASLMVFMLKHLDGVRVWIAGHRSQREDVRGRIKDIRLYLALLRAFVEEEEMTPAFIQALLEAQRSADPAQPGVG